MIVSRASLEHLSCYIIVGNYEHFIAGFVQFIQKEICDTNTQQCQQLDSSLRLLMQLISKYNTQKVLPVNVPGPALANINVSLLADNCENELI